jgi:hypothetical protein
MTTPDIAGLCEKLRAVESSGHGGVTTNWHRNPYGPEAANTIERQAAEIKRLRGALDEIINLCPATCETSDAHSMADIARAALTGEDR